MQYSRITVNPEQMAGVPCVRGLRIPVSTVVDMVANGMSEEDIISELPDLQSDDIRECLVFAAEAVREKTLPLTGTK